jgi:hypothetical protein
MRSGPPYPLNQSNDNPGSSQAPGGEVR